MGSYNIIYKVIETFLSFIFDLKLDIKHAEICLIVLWSNIYKIEPSLFTIFLNDGNFSSSIYWYINLLSSSPGYIYKHIFPFSFL